MQKVKKLQEERKTIFDIKYVDMDLVCCKMDGMNFNLGRFSHIFADTMNEYNLPKIRFHDLRHSNATLMLKANIPAKIASTRLGHSSIGITMDLYSHVSNSMQNDAVNALDQKIYSGIANKKLTN